MPHTRQPPVDTASILATATPDPEWVSALEECPLPRGSDYGSDPLDAITLLKQMGQATYPRQRAALDASRPTNVVEIEVAISIPPTQLIPTPASNRVIICHSTPPPIKNAHEDGDEIECPVIVLFHGGGHSLGTPEMELPLARFLVQTHSAIVILPSYRLAPEHPFPGSFNDCFETLKQIAQDAITLSSPLTSPATLPLNLLPDTLQGLVDAKKGFILGGTSAGSTITSSISHLYNTHRTSDPSLTLPPLTGLFLSCGTIINPRHVPSKYKDAYLSQSQNKNCSPIDSTLYDHFYAAMNADFGSPIMSSLDQHPHLSRPSPAEDHAWLRGEHKNPKHPSVKVYLQACGLDISRDDTLIHERLLRGEVGVETRLDLYAGFGHCFWGITGVYARMEMTGARMRHTVEGVGWLLRRGS